jgi:hypothetical protein
MSYLKNFLVILVLLILSLSAVQKRFGFIRTKPLNGVFPVTPKPAFSCSTFMAGTYQEQLRLSREDSVGFKPDLVRLYNQLDFSLFSVPHAARMVIGKENYLFADTYIKGYTGADFVGSYYIDQKLKNLKWIQDYLWNEKGILVLVAFAPGKGFYYPEYIPDRWLKNTQPVTNYSYTLDGCKNMGINHIDFNQWLISMKDTSRYTLYPKTGIHWSSYGAFLCADSLQRYVAARLNRTLPEMVLDSIKVQNNAWYDDNDQGLTLNLIWEIKQGPLAYPQFHYRYDSVQPKPEVLFIGDSFYWYWYNSGIMENIFNNKSCWYYNNEVYPEQFTKPTSVGQFDFVQATLSKNVIVLIQTNGGYGNLGYGWVDVAYDYLYSGQTRAKEIHQQMTNSASWTKSLEEKAKGRGITTDHMMRLDAIYMMNQEILGHPYNKASLKFMQ